MNIYSLFRIKNPPLVLKNIIKAFIILVCINIFMTTSSVAEEGDYIYPTSEIVQLLVPISQGVYDGNILRNSGYEPDTYENLEYLGPLHLPLYNTPRPTVLHLSDCEWYKHSSRTLYYYSCSVIYAGKKINGTIITLEPTTTVLKTSCPDSGYTEKSTNDKGEFVCRIPPEIPLYEPDCDSTDLNPNNNAYPLLSYQKDQYTEAANAALQRINNLQNSLSGKSPCATANNTAIAKALGFFDEVENKVEPQWLNQLNDKYSDILPNITSEIEKSIRDNSFIKAKKALSNNADAQHCNITTGNNDYRIEIDENVLAGAPYHANASLAISHEFGHESKMQHLRELEIGNESKNDYRMRVIGLFVNEKNKGLKSKLLFSELINNPHILEISLEIAGDTPCNI